MAVLSPTGPERLQLQDLPSNKHSGATDDVSPIEGTVPSAELRQDRRFFWQKRRKPDPQAIATEVRMCDESRGHTPNKNTVKRLR